MNKTRLIQSVIAAFREEFETLQNSSRKVRADGNDAESKAEGKYDTRSTEENYLADGLARQAQGVVDAAAACENLRLRDFSDGSPIDLSALVRLEFADETAWFFLAPAGGGTEVQCEGVPVTVITPESPLGAQLLGRRSGEKTSTARILAVR